LAACFAGDSERIVPGLSANSGDALAREVSHYLDSHPECSVVRVHALRPGDAATVVRALGKALIAEPHPDGELDRLLREPTDYEPNFVERSDRAFIFCPDYTPTLPE